MADEKKARGSYSVGVATHEAILNAAKMLISDSGYYGFSLRDVAKIVGISHPAVIYHFPSKEALLLSVVERYESEIGILDVTQDQASGKLVENGVRVNSIYEAGFSLMRLAKQPDADLVLSLDCMLTAEAANEDHPVHAHYQNAASMLDAFLSQEIEKLVTDEKNRFQLTSKKLAGNLVRNWYGVGLRSRFYKSGDEPNSIETFLAESAHTMSLSSENLIRIAAEVPEDVADVFGRVLRLIRAMQVN